MDAVTIANLGAYCAQVLCLAVGAGVLLWALRVDSPGLRYACLRATLVMCLLLPWLQSRHATAPRSAAVATILVASPGTATDAAPSPPHSGIDWTGIVPVVLAAGAVARFLWLAVGLHRLHRLRRQGEPADAPDAAELQETVGTRAEIRYIAGFSQPVTFGVWRPVVLLPEGLRQQPAEVREAVLAHELVHVRRRDWAWVVAEEIARSIFWFHPALWWLISRIQLAREEVVDRIAVGQTGRRLVYVQALLAFADGIPLAPATAFARRRHLFRRMMLISREDVMTSRRFVASSFAMLLLMGIGGWYAVSAFPLLEPGAGQILQKQPGPLEQVANPVTPENPVPRRLRHQPAEYPPGAADANAWISVTMKLTIDASGSVAEARVTRVSLRTDELTVSFDGRSATMKGVNVVSSGDVMTDIDQFLDKAVIRPRPGAGAEPVGVIARPLIDAAVNAAAAAVERWRYDAPVNAPISLDTTFYFAPGAPATDTPAAAAPDDRLKGGLRVGGNIKQPKKIKDVRPVYPPDAQEARVQGVVILETRIDPEGRVSDARVLRSIPMLDQAALDAVRQWEFEPTLLNGVPTPIIMTVTIQFSLQ